MMSALSQDKVVEFLGDRLLSAEEGPGLVLVVGPEGAGRTTVLRRLRQAGEQGSEPLQIVTIDGCLWREHRTPRSLPEAMPDLLLFDDLDLAIGIDEEWPEVVPAALVRAMESPHSCVVATIDVRYVRGMLLWLSDIGYEGMVIPLAPAESESEWLVAVLKEQADEFTACDEDTQITDDAIVLASTAPGCDDATHPGCGVQRISRWLEYARSRGYGRVGAGEVVEYWLLEASIEA